MQPAQLIDFEVTPDLQLNYQAVLKDPFNAVWKCFDKKEVNHHIIVESFNVLWYHLEKYILHSEIVINQSKNYNIPLVEAALIKCKNFLKWIPDHNPDIWQLVEHTISMN